MKLTKQRCFDPRDPDYDGPDDDEECQELDFESDEPWLMDMDNPADDYITTNYENYVNNHF